MVSESQLDLTLRVPSALLPLINRRDVLSMAHTDLSSSLNSTLTSLSKTQRDNVIAVKINRELTGTLLNLAAEAEVKVIQDDIDPKLRDQLDNLEEQIEMQRSKWRVMKKVVSAIVVGSGIDWARNDEFRELVMDDENGDGP